MAKIQYIKDQQNVTVFPVTHERAVRDSNGVLLETKLASFITASVNNLVNYYLKSDTYTKTEVNDLIAAINQFSYETTSSLPTASASTMYKIYLIPAEDPKTQNAKDEYITVRSGSSGSYTYTWEQIGSTAIDLSGYVTTSALNTALSDYTTTANLTTIMTGKQDVISDLTTIRNGASAGATAYQKPNSGIPKTDLVPGVQSSLDRADTATVRTYNTQNPDGLGYLVLSKDSTLASQLSAANTIYEIRYDYDLSNGSLTIPENCTLQFNGGSFSNGTLVGNKTRIVSSDRQIFSSITFDGTFLDALNACWVGAKASDSTFDNSSIIQAWFSGYADCFRELYFPLGTYYFLTGASLTSDKRNLVLNGGNSTFNVNIPTDDAYFITLSNPSASASSGENFRFEDIRIVNTKTTSGVHLSKTMALFLDRAQRFSIQNVQFWYFDIAITLKDCWYGGIGDQSFFYGNRIGIHAPRGNAYELNTIEFANVNFSGVARSTIETLYPQESGETDADYLMRTGACAFDSYVLLQGVSLRGCTFEGWDYGVRANWSSRTSSTNVTGGGFTIDGCYFEANRQEDIYFGEGNYKNDGTGTGVLRYSHHVNILACRFHTRLHSAICGGSFVFVNNQPTTVKILPSSYVVTSIDYDGDITFEDTTSSNQSIHKYSHIGYASIYQTNGSQSAGYQSIKPILFSRDAGQIRSKLASFAYDSSTPGNDEFVSSPWSFLTQPSVRYALDIKPFDSYRDQRNSFSKLMIPSGESFMPVSCDDSYNFKALNCNGGIPLYEFIRRWKAGTNYTGRVQNLFPFEITANPTNGTIYDASNTLVGFGINAIGNVSFPVNKYYVFVDAMVVMRYSYSEYKLYADILQCGRTFQEVNRGVDDANPQYIRLWGTNGQLASIQKRINAIFYDTTNSKLLIYNGFEWVDMTSPYQRYYYKSYGVTLSERATIPDMVGQTFHNSATGITYVFTFGGGQNGRTPRWVSGIGLVDSLEHPNGYANDSTLDYANELTSGDKVVCNNVLYTWNGTAFVQENPVQALTAGGKKIWTGTQADYDLLTPSNDTLYFITSS